MEILKLNYYSDGIIEQPCENWAFNYNKNMNFNRNMQKIIEKM